MVQLLDIKEPSTQEGVENAQIFDDIFDSEFEAYENYSEETR